MNAVQTVSLYDRLARFDGITNRMLPAAESMGFIARVRMIETQKRGSAVQLHAM